MQEDSALTSLIAELYTQLQDGETTDLKGLDLSILAEKQLICFVFDQDNNSSVRVMIPETIEDIAKLLDAHPVQAVAVSKQLFRSAVYASSIHNMEDKDDLDKPFWYVLEFKHRRNGTRTYNLLRRDDYYSNVTIKQLLNIGEQELMGINGFGEATLMCLRSELRAKGFLNPEEKWPKY